MGDAIHSEAFHEELKRDEARWQALPFPRKARFVTWGGYDDEPRVRFECRNCTCGSTIQRPVSGSPSAVPTTPR